MQGHARLNGSLFQTLEIDGKTYTLRPHVVGIVAEMEAYIVSRRVDPMVIAATTVSEVPEEHHRAIWDAAMRAAVSARTVSAEEQSGFEKSLRGVAFQLWACLKQDHGDKIKTVDDAMNLMELAGEDRIAEIAAKVFVASGQADLGNSSGRSRTPAQDSQQAGDHSTADGLASTAIS